MLGIYLQFWRGIIFNQQGKIKNCPKTPWDVMGCQNHLFGGPFRGVTFGGSGVSIGGVGSLRVQRIAKQVNLDVQDSLYL